MDKCCIHVRIKIFADKCLGPSASVVCLCADKLRTDKFFTFSQCAAGAKRVSDVCVCRANFYGDGIACMSCPTGRTSGVGTTDVLDCVEPFQIFSVVTFALSFDGIAAEDIEQVCVRVFVYASFLVFC